MSNSLPGSRPQKTKQQIIDLITAKHPFFVLPDFYICGIRGYYKDSMGQPGVNDRKIYDDALFLIGKDEFYAFNGNTDPSAFRLSIATLKAGIYQVWKFDLHNGKYLALCQRGGVMTVIRDGKGEDTGNFGINNHRGGVWGTGSLGCQTVPPSQWDEYIATAQQLAKKYYGPNWKLKSDYTYVLLEV